MKVVILAGGFGTRIRDVSSDIPKPMIPIGNLPVLFHVMKSYAHFGHKDFIICLGYKGYVIKDFFLNLDSHTRNFSIDFSQKGKIVYDEKQNPIDWNVTLVDTGANSMTGSRISRIRDFIDEDDFFLTYGDGVSDIDIDVLEQYHRSHGKILTVSGVRPPGRFGEMVSNSEGLITEFNEKPQATAGRISGGFFVAKPQLFDYLNDDQSLVFEQEPMKKLVDDEELMLFEHNGFWQCMDTARDHDLLEGLYQNDEAPWVY